jgi:hypothetical protein
VGTATLCEFENIKSFDEGKGPFPITKRTNTANTPKPVTGHHKTHNNKPHLQQLLCPARKALIICFCSKPTTEEQSRKDSIFL